MLFNNNSLIIVYHIFGFVNIIFVFYSKLIQNILKITIKQTENVVQNSRPCIRNGCWCR